MLLFYDNDLSTCAQKVRLMLNERQAVWETIWLDLRAGDQNSPEYRAIHPKGVVPAIKDGDAVILESNNILYFLDERLDGSSLMGDHPIDRHRTRAWLLELDVDLHGAIGTLSVGIAFRHDYLERGPDAIARHLAGTPDPVRRQRWAEAIELGTDMPQFGHALARWLGVLDKMEVRLREHGWLSGSNFGLIDIAYAPYVTRLDHLGILAMRRAVVPGVVEWFASLQQRPCYRAAITDIVPQKKIDRLRTSAAKERAKISALMGDPPEALA